MAEKESETPTTSGDTLTCYQETHPAAQTQPATGLIDGTVVSNAAGQADAAGMQRAAVSLSPPDLQNRHINAELLCLRGREVRRSSGQSWGAGSRIVWLFVQTPPVPGPHVSWVYGSSTEMMGFDLLLWPNGLNEFEITLTDGAIGCLQQC